MSSKAATRMLPISCKPHPTGQSMAKAYDAPKLCIENARAPSTACCVAIMFMITHPQGACAVGKCRQAIWHLLEVQRLRKLLVGPAADNENTRYPCQLVLCANGTASGEVKQHGNRDL